MFRGFRIGVRASSCQEKGFRRSYIGLWKTGRTANPNDEFAELETSFFISKSKYLFVCVSFFRRLCLMNLNGVYLRGFRQLNVKPFRFCFPRWRVQIMLYHQSKPVGIDFDR